MACVASAGVGPVACRAIARGCDVVGERWGARVQVKRSPSTFDRLRSGAAAKRGLYRARCVCYQLCASKRGLYMVTFIAWGVALIGALAPRSTGAWIDEDFERYRNHKELLAAWPFEKGRQDARQSQDQFLGPGH